MRLRGLCLSTLCWIVTGCSTACRYDLPPVEVTESWSSPLCAAIETQEVEEPWWTLFGDPLLDGYIERLHKDNLDAKIAFERVYEAHMACVEASSYLLPQVAFELGEEHSVPARTGGFMGGSPFEQEQGTRDALFTASWEVDLLGRLSRQREAAGAVEAINCSDAYGLMVSLIGDFVIGYFQTVGLHLELACVKEELLALQEKDKRIRLRIQQGIDDATVREPVLVAIKKLEEAQSKIEADYRAGAYHLANLLSVTPGCLVEEIGKVKGLPRIPEEIAVGLPSELTRRRPDLLRAEWELAKASADMGVALADRFPKLSLTGSLGYQALKLGGLAWDGFAWSYGGQLLQTVFDGGRTSARIAQQGSIAEQASLNYEKAVLNALMEAESSLVYFQSARQREGKALAACRAQRRLLLHALSRMNSGIANRIQVIDQRRTFLQEKRVLIQRKTDSLKELAGLYKALGGGWAWQEAQEQTGF